MSGYIAAGKSYIKGVISNVKELLHKKIGKEASICVSFVAYRDFGDAGQLNVTPFTENSDAVCAKVDLESASGGGDYPEDIAGALHKTYELNWRERSAKFAILICDAPCHNTSVKTFHNHSDNHVHTNTTGMDNRGYKDPDSQLIAFREKNIKFMITEMSNRSLEMMISKFEIAYNRPVTEGHEFKLQRLESDPSKILEQTAKLVDEISSTISTTIMAEFQ